MYDYVSRMLAARGLPPHGYCLLWDPVLVWTHVVADLLIGLAYFSIPLVLGKFLAKRRDVEFGWVGWLFAAFIMACGVTHFMKIVVLWVPAYGIEGLIKLVTALISVATAVALWPLLPKLIALPSPRQLAIANEDLLQRVQERDEALAALQHETADRERAEEMLRQSQKMEAVGQLTGGIAHDFNNLLMVMVGNLERARRLAPKDEQLQTSLESALEGADRAAKLNAQLLAFARRQPLMPSAQDLSCIVGDMSSLLKSTLGPTYDLVFNLEPHPPKVIVDRLQTENVILNLAINARDAMPGGGTLTITTDASEKTVILSVSDTGIGINSDIRNRIFEPFFTTKPFGQGTGLGLSQVYGFTKQSGGEIEVESEPRVGTTIRIILPQDDRKD